MPSGSDYRIQMAERTRKAIEEAKQKALAEEAAREKPSGKHGK